ncbi:ArsR family transcriptional regulator [Gammaproteobacteria bacterium 45_16_T64]|nr:ArsR family transcriptional regulator [Gammaproteobacteria bacterium 45_16_T64]
MTQSAAQELSYLDLASLLKGAGDPLRLEILRALKTDSLGVLELCNIFDIKQSGMSHHLKVLAKAGAVTTRREGNSIFYRRILADKNSASGQLLNALYLAIDTLALSELVLTNIRATKQHRADAAKLFFNKNASQFREQQETIAPYAQYAENAKDLLLHSFASNTDKPNCILEIGPGEGAFLEEIAPLCQQVIALDISEEMLEKAQHHCQNKQLNNISFMLGDTQTALKETLRPDHIICNMVLHHVPSPADVFNDTAKLLPKGGSLIVTDLCRHDQSWAIDNCGDLWLGFDPDELSQWALAAGFEDKESLYLGLRNGFQVQVRRFEIR